MLASFVMLRVFVACELVEALDAEAFHLMHGAFGGCFGFLHACEELGENAAKDVFTLGVRGVGRRGDGGDGVEVELGRIRFQSRSLG